MTRLRAVLRRLQARLRTREARRAGLVTLAAALVLGGAAGGAWIWWSAQESRARMALAQALEAVSQAQAADATPEAQARAVRALEGFLAAHGASSLAPQAAYRLGNLHYAAGRLAEARGAYEIALAKGARGTLASLAALGIAYTWEAQRDWGRAQAAYRAALERLGGPGDFLYEDVLASLARTQELAGDRPGAIQTWERLLKDLPDTRRADQARTRLASLQSPAR